MKISNGVKAISLIILVLFIDQLVKIEIKTTMTIGEGITVFGNWFFTVSVVRIWMPCCGA